jgi:hypothetical protein
MWNDESHSRKRCEYCNDKQSFLVEEFKFYNYGFKKKNVLVCFKCSQEKAKESHPHLIAVVGRDRIHEEICQAIKIKSTPAKPSDPPTPVNFYDAVKAAYEKDGQLTGYLRIRSKLYDSKKIDKKLRPLLNYTYKIANGLDKRITVVNKNADDFLVTWSYSLTE